MRDLVGERCVACRGDSPRVTDAEVGLLHPHVPDWELIDRGGVDRLRRRFRFRDYRRGVEFAVAVADLAEEEGHHPRLTVEWGRVTVEWWTHAIRGLHRNDFIMAAKTDRAFEEGKRVAFGYPSEVPGP